MDMMNTYQIRGIINCLPLAFIITAINKPRESICAIMFILGDINKILFLNSCSLALTIFGKCIVHITIISTDLTKCKF